MLTLALWQGGYFKARMKFPETYPMDPPSMVMMQPMWHPNIYEVPSAAGALLVTILVFFLRMVGCASPFCTLRGKMPSAGS